MVESIAQSSSLFSFWARSFSRSSLCCSVMVWVSLVIWVGVSCVVLGVLVVFCHRATWL